MMLEIRGVLGIVAVVVCLGAFILKAVLNIRASRRPNDEGSRPWAWRLPRPLALVFNVGVILLVGFMLVWFLASFLVR